MIKSNSFFVFFFKGHVINESAKHWIDEIFNQLKPNSNNKSNSNETIVSKNEQTLKATTKAGQINIDYKNCCQSQSLHMFSERVRRVSEFCCKSAINDIELKIKDDMFTKFINSSDLVTPNSTRTSCFTKK